MERIELNPEICGGAPVIRGTRIAVQTILGFLSAGDAVEDVLSAYPQLQRDDVLACAEYARYLTVAPAPVFTSVEAAIAPIKEQLRAAGVERLGVFGSVARGEAKPSSDIDVLVSFRPEARTYDNLYLVGELLEGAFRRRVDLVTEDALSPYIGPRIKANVAYVDLAA